MKGDGRPALQLHAAGTQQAYRHGAYDDVPGLHVPRGCKEAEKSNDRRRTFHLVDAFSHRRPKARAWIERAPAAASPVFARTAFAPVNAPVNAAVNAARRSAACAAASPPSQTEPNLRIHRVMIDRAFTIAIDGPAASGKGTISKALAARFGLAHLDTGLIYRAVGAVAAETGRDAAEVAAGLTEADLARPDLRSGAAAQAASRVAAVPEVRAALLDFQRAFAARAGGAVLDGRDIGTVICPDAEVKLYVTASAAARALRRHAELAAKGDTRTLDEIRADIDARDRRDSERAAAPLKPAADARLIDTTKMTIDDAVAEAARWINEQLSKARG